jgi:RNA polymerase sigma-70 factor (ECF subfamily)
MAGRPTVSSVAPAEGAPTPEEAVLLGAALSGDRDAIERLWERYRALVRGIIVSVLGPSFETDDLVHDVFIKLLKSLREVRRPESIRSYVVALTVTTARSELRRRRVRRIVQFLPPCRLPERPGPSSDPELRDVIARLRRGLDRLPADERLVFALRYVELFELKEIAEATGTSLATTKRHLAKARERLFASMSSDPALAPFLAEGCRFQGEPKKEGSS